MFRGSATTNWCVGRGGGPAIKAGNVSYPERDQASDVELAARWAAAMTSRALCCKCTLFQALVLDSGTGVVTEQISLP